MDNAEANWTASGGPLVGAVAGAFGIIIGADKLGVDRDYVAMGAAVIGLMTAANMSGWVRDLAAGVAAAGATIAIMERFAPAEKTSHVIEPAKRQADGNLVTRDELQRALTKFAEEQQQAQAKMHADLRRAVLETIRAAVAERSEQEASTIPAAPVEEQPKTDAAPIERSPVIEKVVAIASQLSETERAKLQEFIDSAPEESLRLAQSVLAPMTVDEAVHYLRHHVFNGVAA
jgi:hypothetical protein